MLIRPVAVLYATLAVALLTATSASVEAQSSRQVADDHRFGCQSKDYHDRLVGYAMNDDVEAFKKGLAAGILVGECLLFKRGEEVFVVDTKIFSGLVKIRQKGKLPEYWTALETIDNDR